ncbi:MAG: GMC family oxidoreductase [Patulibacter sp.]|nr:GMC family oxidoreductase [Patulibacter sp.]
MSASQAAGGPAQSDFDVDYVVIGSGFGGSVSALRLTEKGYSVAILEQGRRFEDSDLPKSSFDLKKYYWNPRLGLRGIWKLTAFKDVFIMSGTSVGGGSNVYAMTLYTPPDRFFEDPQWAGMADWKSTLAPHFETAQRMLGVTDVRRDDKADQWLKEYAQELGVEHTYRKTRVGAYLDTPGKTVSDPYFGGEGPDRTGCIQCGRCMIGCPVGSKNTLLKNYLWFAEKRGATINADRTVVDIRPIDGDRGATGWYVEHEATGRRGGVDRRVIRARGVVVSGGALGSNTLLQRARLQGSLPHISPRLGDLVRTNSESILAVTVAPEYAAGIGTRVAISSSIYPDPDTHIETCVFGKAGDTNRYMMALLTGDGTRVTRPLKAIGQILRHPGNWFKLFFSKNWSSRTIVVLVMQSLDNSLKLKAKPKRGGGVKLQTQQSGKPNPTYIAAGNKFAEWLAAKTDGIAGSGVLEAMANIPTTAHFLGGVPIGPSAEQGVVDGDLKVYGYENLMVVDGAAMPANVGVNPSLTITALAEHAMAAVPPADGKAGDVAHIGTAPIAGQTAVAEPLPLFQASIGTPH